MNKIWLSQIFTVFENLFNGLKNHKKIVSTCLPDDRETDLTLMENIAPFEGWKC